MISTERFKPYISVQHTSRKMGFFDDVIDRGQEAVDDAVDTVTGNDEEPSQEQDAGSEPNQATEDFVDQYGPGEDNSSSETTSDPEPEPEPDTSPEERFVDRYNDSEPDTESSSTSDETIDNDDGRSPSPPDNTADNDPNTAVTAETSTGTDTQTEDTPNNNEDIESEISEAEQTRVQVQKTRDDILARYKDDERYRIDPDQLSENQKQAIDYNKPENTTGNPNIILKGSELENRVVEEYNQEIQEIDQFIAKAEQFQDKQEERRNNVAEIEPALNPLDQPTVENVGQENQGFLDRFTDNPAETTLRSGVGLMQYGQDNLQQPVENFFDRFDQPRLGTSPINNEPPTQNQIANQIEQDRETQKALEDQVGPVDDVVGSGAGGAATFGTQFGGLAIATPGAVGTSLREDTPGLKESAAQGPGLVKDEFTSNPAEFVASEAGEELGEAAIFGASTGGLGLAAAAVPTPEFTVTAETSSPSEDFTVDQTPDRREFDEPSREDVPQLQDQSLEREPEAPLIRDDITGLQEDRRIGQEPGQSSAPLEQQEGLTIGDIEALAGREITPGERADIEARLRQEDFQRVGNVREIVQDALNDPNALGSGPGALVPPETQQPDIEFEQDFVENDLRTDPMLEQENSPQSDLGVFDRRPQNTQPDRTSFDSEQDVGLDNSLLPDNPPALDSDVQQGQQPEQNQAPGQRQDEDQPFDFEPGEFLGPDFVNTEMTQDPEPEPEPPRITEGTVDFGPEPTPGQDNTPDNRGSGQENEGFTFDDFEENVDFQKEEGRFASSLTAGLFDIQAEEEFNEEEFVGTGTDIRPLIPEDEEL